MKSKICPYRKHCHDVGICEDCDYGKTFEKLNKKIKKLETKNGALRAENKELKNRIEVLMNPNF